MASEKQMFPEGNYRKYGCPDCKGRSPNKCKRCMGRYLLRDWVITEHGQQILRPGSGALVPGGSRAPSAAHPWVKQKAAIAKRRRDADR